MTCAVVDFYKNRKVLVTGHTGFKGAWLTWWLGQLGAKVLGVALDPNSSPNLCDSLNLSDVCDDFRLDICDGVSLKKAVTSFDPEVVFHLAAQSIVLRGFSEPENTFKTNVQGTVHLLEGLRSCPSLLGIAVITSDKCYRNDETGHPFSENDALGGHDPYSASKAAAEMVVDGYRPIFSNEGGRVRIATARAGNIIGGGDWSDYRLIPDLIRAILSKQPLQMRLPSNIRPWQHVLDPLYGYLDLGRRLSIGEPEIGSAFNFGPSLTSCRSAEEVVVRFIEHWGEGSWEDISAHQEDAQKEAEILYLDNTKASQVLNWTPHLDFDTSVKWTSDWYKACQSEGDAKTITSRQISDYMEIITGGAKLAPGTRDMPAKGT